MNSKIFCCSGEMFSLDKIVRIYFTSGFKGETRIEIYILGVDADCPVILSGKDAEDFLEWVKENSKITYASSEE